MVGDPTFTVFSFSMLKTFFYKAIVDIGLDPNNYSSNSFRMDKAHVSLYGVSPDFIQLRYDCDEKACI
jgi:hypothetical protein